MCQADLILSIRGYMSKRNKEQRVPIFVVLILAVIVAAAGGAYYVISQRIPSKTKVDLKSYFHIEADDAVGISAGGRISETTGRIIDGVTYLDYDSVHQTINPGFYYEESSKALIVTTPTQKLTLDLSDGGVSKEREAMILNGTLYLSLSYVESLSDIAVTEYPEDQYVSVKTGWSYQAARAIRETIVRTEPSIKGDVLETVSSDAVLECLDEAADEDWMHVRTASGRIGYVKKQDLSETFEQTDEHTSPIGTYTTAYDGPKVNMAFHQTTSQAANDALPQVLANVTGINVVAPTWFFLNDQTGNMTSIASAAYVETAHAMGLKVWAVMNDFDGGVNSGEATKTALSVESNRMRIIETVMSGIDASGADGLNVDFERVNRDSAESFLQLIRELSVECRNRGIVLSIDNYVPTFTKFMNRREQARVADFVVTMCYDEHTGSSEEAGSVASLPFMRNGLKATMTEDGVPASKMIAAIPFYTRLWTTSGDGSIESTAYGMADAKAAAENLKMELSWNQETSQNYGKVKNGDLTYQIWLEDEDSIRAKMEVIRELGLAGAAEWKLGQENNGVWSIIAEYLG